MWRFKCRLGLRQDFCGMYELDKNSRGYRAGLGGCPSCKHRIPADSETAYYEAEFAEAISKKKV